MPGSLCHPDRNDDLYAMLENGEFQDVLLVGEGEEFLANGGIIAFKLVNDEVKFLINLDAAERADIHFRSQLLQVAEIFQRPQGE